MTAKSEIRILALGESLFDCFPDGKSLGGAPLNFAVHGVRLGATVALVTRVGEDELGKTIEQRLLHEGVNCDYLQCDRHKQTGKVLVNLAENGEPEYQILENVAWDYLTFAPQLVENLSNYDCIYFGTLAQRNSVTKTTICQYLNSFHGFRFLDLNLRTPHYDKTLIQESILIADGLKLNLSEAEYLTNNCSFNRNLQNWLDQYHLQWIVLTQGAQGTKWIDKTQIIELEPVSIIPRENADTVGAGDAVAAIAILGYLQGLSPTKIVRSANQIGAYIASFSGGIPPHIGSTYSDF